MKVIGITGGVGAGKSTILSYIEKNYNSKIIMADDVAKKLEEPGQECYFGIVESFGSGILSGDMTIDKAKLASVIFSSEENLKKINSIVHPAVKRHIVHIINEEAKKGELDYLVIEAALLIEDNYNVLCDEMWYIYTSCDNRRRRLKESRGYSDEKIDSIFANQLSENEFRNNCNVVIDNNFSEEKTYMQIDKALEGR